MDLDLDAAQLMCSGCTGLVHVRRRTRVVVFSRDRMTLEEARVLQHIESARHVLQSPALRDASLRRGGGGGHEEVARDAWRVIHRGRGISGRM